MVPDDRVVPRSGQVDLGGGLDVPRDGAVLYDGPVVPGAPGAGGKEPRRRVRPGEGWNHSADPGRAFRSTAHAHGADKGVVHGYVPPGDGPEGTLINIPWDDVTYHSPAKGSIWLLCPSKRFQREAPTMRLG